MPIKSIIEQNVNFSIKLIEQVIKKKINIQIASSASVYGNLSDFKEESILKPESPYAVSKFLVEKFISSLGNKKKSNYVQILCGFQCQDENVLFGGGFRVARLEAKSRYCSNRTM